MAEYYLLILEDLCMQGIESNIKKITLPLLLILVASCSSTPASPPPPPPEPLKIINVSNLSDPLEEEVVVSSKKWDDLPKSLIGRGELDYYLETKINKNDLSEYSRVWLKAVFPENFPSFSQLKYVDKNGKPATETMYGGGSDIQTQSNFFDCDLNYKMTYRDFSGSSIYSTSCYFQNSFGGFFRPDDMDYFLENGFKARVSGSADVNITFDPQEIIDHMAEVEKVRDSLRL